MGGYGFVSAAVVSSGAAFSGASIFGAAASGAAFSGAKEAEVGAWIWPSGIWVTGSWAWIVGRAVRNMRRRGRARDNILKRKFLLESSILGG